MVRIAFILFSLCIGAVAQSVLATTVRLYPAGAVPNPYVVARILDPTWTSATTTRGLHRNLNQAPALSNLDSGRDVREERINAAAHAALSAWQTQLRQPDRRAHELVRSDDNASQVQSTALALSIKFGHNSARLSPRSLAALDAVAAGIKLARNTNKITIEGHTDARGNYAHNLRLSQKRAASVKRYLIRVHAIAPDRLVALGLGSNAPLNRENRFAAENRRVQFRAIQTS